MTGNTRALRLIRGDNDPSGHPLPNIRRLRLALNLSPQYGAALIGCNDMTLLWNETHPDEDIDFARQALASYAAWLWGAYAEVETDR